MDFKKGNTVRFIYLALAHSDWTVVSCNKTHVHIRNIHGVMMWVEIDKVRLIKN